MKKPISDLLTGQLLTEFRTVKSMLEIYCQRHHDVQANIGYALIALHAAAAIYHHHVLKDNTLTNMLPERK